MLSLEKNNLHLNSNLISFLRNTFLISLILLGFNAFCQNQPLSINLGVKDGLPSNTVYSIVEDTSGFIWVATNNGVSRYNSFGFTNFTTKEGLTSNDVTAIYCDKNGTIWADCFGALPCFFKNGSFNKIKLSESGLVNYKLTITQPSKNIFFISNNDFNIFINNCTNKKTWKLNYESEILGSIQLISYLEGSPDTLFANLKSQKGKDFIVIDTDYKKRMFEKKSYTTLAIPYSNFVYRTLDSIIELFEQRKEFYYSAQKFYFKGRITNLIPVQDGFFILVNKRDVYKSEFGNFRLIIKSKVDLRNLFIDKSGNYWIATEKHGILFIKQNSPFNMMQLKEYEQFTFLSSLKADNALFVNTDKRHGKIKKFKEGQIVNIQQSDHLQTDFVRAFETGSVISSDKSNWYYDKKDKPRINLGEKPGAIKDFYEINSHQIILGTHAFFALFDIDERKISSEIWNRRARKILKISEDIYVLLGVDEAIIYNSKTKLKIAHASIGSYKDAIIVKGHLLLIDTENRVRIFDCQLNEIRKQALFDNVLKNSINAPFTINSIFVTADGMVYFSCNLGWFCFYFDEKTKNLNYSSEYAFMGNSDNDNVLQITELDGVLYAITPDRLLKLSKKPEQLKIGKVICEKFLVKNNIQSVMGIKRIARDSNDISIRLAITTNIHKQNIGFQYRLKGLTENWQFSNDPLLRFSSLPPGKYSLEIKPQTSSVTFGGIFTVVQFNILPYFYETLWFKIVILILVGLLIYLTTRYFIGRKSNEEKKVLAYENQVTELKLKSLQSNMNPHFIFNALNSIQYFYIQNDLKKANHFLNRFSTIIRTVLENSKSSFTTLQKEIQFLNYYLELEKMRMKEKLNYKILFDPSLLDEFIELPQMLIQPYIENSIEHGLINGGNIEVSFILKNDILEIVIEDDGIGINASKRNRKDSHHRSMATDMNDQRFSLMRNYFKQNYKVHIYDKNDSKKGTNGTIVRIELAILWKRK